MNIRPSRLGGGTPVPLITESGARIEHVATGSGTPVTVFGHGLAGSIATTRPFGGGVAGTKVFLHFRGHGDSTPGPMTYAALAGDLRAVADEYVATRALGVSMGAGALARLVTWEPGRFDRLVFVLPAHLDGARTPASTAYWDRLWSAVASGKAERLLELEVPEERRGTPEAAAFLRGQLGVLSDPEFRVHAEELALDQPLPDPGELAAVTAPALVIGCEGDDRHPASVARRLAELLPKAELHVYPEPAPMWRFRDDLRARVSGFLRGGA